MKDLNFRTLTKAYTRTGTFDHLGSNRYEQRFDSSPIDRSGNRVSEYRRECLSVLAIHASNLAYDSTLRKRLCLSFPAYRGRGCTGALSRKTGRITHRAEAQRRTAAPLIEPC